MRNTTAMVLILTLVVLRIRDNDFLRFELVYHF